MLNGDEKRLLMICRLVLEFVAGRIELEEQRYLQRERGRPDGMGGGGGGGGDEGGRTRGGGGGGGCGM